MDKFKFHIYHILLKQNSTIDPLQSHHSGLDGILLINVLYYLILKLAVCPSFPLCENAMGNSRRAWKRVTGITYVNGQSFLFLVFVS